MLKDVEKKAHDYSVRSFLNSFFRDYASDPRVTREENAFVINLKENQKLIIPLKSFSLLGNHKYESGIDFNELAKKLMISFFNKGEQNEFFKNTSNSLFLMEKAIEKNLLNTKFNSYLESEKKLILGHPVHPYPKTKLGMDEKEIEEFSPEFNGKFKLVWLKVKPESLTSNLALNDYKKYFDSLSSFDLKNTADNDLYLPMHPYQWKFLQDSNKVDKNSIEYIGEGLNDWHALSSTRSIYNEDAPYQLKYSMNVKLTNSIRHLQPEEAIRGEFIESVFKENNLLQLYPELNILFEPFYLSFKGNDGKALPEFTLQVRENFPENKEKTERVLLSTLVEENIQTEETHLSELISKLAVDLNKEKEFIRIEWFKVFLKNAISPLLKLAFNSDVLLGAHLQNIILELKEGVPSGLIYRDCQGTGFTEAGEVKYGKINNGNVLSLSDINKVFGYYLVVNTIFGVVSSLANSDETHERILINRFRLFLIELKSELKETSFIDFLLESPVLYQKGNFRCSVNELNENTIKNPWEIYNEIPNPISLYLRELKEETRTGELYRATSLKGKKLSFSLFDIEKDLDLFHTWHHKEFVYDFWEMNVSKEELKTYVLKLLESPYQMPLIFKVDDVSVGYFEAYWAYDDRIAPYCDPDMYDRGIHLLIGEEKYLRTYLVFESMLHVSKFLFEEDKKTQKVWGEPRADNQKIMRFAEKLPGWKFIKEFDFPHKRAALLECDRTRFYEEFQNDNF